MATTTTPTLTHWGPFLVEADGTEITAVHGHPKDPDPSPIGQNLLDVTRNRIERPAVRQSWLEGGPGTATDQRGSDPFVEVGWDEVVDLVGEEITRVRADKGSEAIFGGSYGWGSAGRFNLPSSQIYRLLRMGGGYTDARGTYSSSAAEVIVPHLMGLNYSQAVGSQTSWSVIAGHTELMVCFGGVRLSNAQVTYGGQGPHLTRHWLDRSTDQGVRFVNFSPLRDDLIDEVDGRWIPVRPNTDSAIMLGLAHQVVADGQHDEDFLTTHCTGWETFCAYLLGQTDGIPKTAPWAESIADLEPGTLTDLAREMTEHRTFINLALAIQRGDHGEYAYWAATALAAVLGQTGLPGGGFGFPFGSNGNVGAGQIRQRIPGISVPPNPLRDSYIPVSRVTEMFENPGGSYRYNGQSRTYPDISLVYWCGGNPFHHHQDLNRLSRAWAHPETVIVQEPFWTPLAKRADIVLPATTPLERNDLGGAETMLVAMKAAVAPVGEARHDYDICAAIAHRLGYGDEFTEGRSIDDWVRHLYEEFAADNDYAPAFDEFWEAGVLQHDMADMGEPEQVFLADFRADPDAHPLETTSGRIELFSVVIDSFDDSDAPPHAAWQEPYEWLGSSAAERFPLHLISNQPADKLHSQYDHSRFSRGHKVAGRTRLRIHPAAAAARGLVDGDVVRVFNDRGASLAGVVVSDAIQADVVELPVGSWYDPDDDGTCRNGNPNTLTRDQGTSSLAQGPSAHTCLVEVEKLEGAAPGVQAYNLPEFVER
ncbi:MAG: molybdopterin-dependent oxidoreductase [Actinomycetia bacterium]|nr:molybdopterin-dependent oxidoreductase [Actinomycetes bacterium]